MTLLSIQKRVTSTGKPLVCEHCNSGDSAVSRCTNCKVFMCEYCVTAHKRINSFLGHQILSLAEVKNLGSKALAKPAFCTKHTDEVLKLYCDTCQKTICRDCTIVDHRDHKYNFVADVAERERKAVEAVLQETKAKDVAVEEGLKAVKAMEIRVEAKIAGVSKDVDVFFDEQVKALEEMRANLKLEVKTQGQAKLKALCNQEEMLALSLAQLRNSIDFAEKALKDGNDLEILSIKQQLIQRLAQLNVSQFHCSPCNSDYLKLKMNKRISDIGEMMTLAHAPDTTECVLSMVGGEEGVLYQTFVGQPVDFKFAIVAGTSVKEAETGFMVRASVKREDQQESQDLPLRDKGDGSYFFSYQPETAGLCTLSVTVEEENVHSSPFKWEVIPKISFSQELQACLLQSKTQQDNEKRKYCWKLKYSGSMPENSKVEVGVSYTRSSSNYRNTWSCQNNTYTARQGSTSSSSYEASITSLQNDDIVSVFLNLNALKLIIYNHRCEQTQVFTNVKRDFSQISPIIVPYRSEPTGSGFSLIVE